MGSEYFCKPKLRTYVTIKNRFGKEKYVTAPLAKRQRSLCAQLRSGVLPLHLETGRYRGTKEEDRTCFYCCTEIENEFHFLFYCPLYQEIRLKLFNRCNNQNLPWMTDADRLRWLFDNKVLALAEFLEKAWEKRAKTIYV